MKISLSIGRLLAITILLHSAYVQAATPNLVSNIERPLRYRPENGGFVIENGPDSFNRPLYGGNTAFRVDAGDRPEFSLYVPGRGGNLRLGIKTGAAAKWLNDMEKISARYQDGAMIYEVHDLILGNGVVRAKALGLAMTEGLILRIECDGLPAGTEVIFAFGGANGDRGSRSGDIGTEREPISRFFALRPEYCRNNRFDISGSNFILQSKPAPGKIAGIMPTNSTIAIGDAAKWNSPNDLLASAAATTDPPVIVGHVLIANRQALYLALQRLSEGNAQQQIDLEAPRVAADQDTPVVRAILASQFGSADLPNAFEKTADYFDRLSHQVRVDTPDPFINSAVPALCLAADAVWDDTSNAYMHGAVAWRTKLLGWRGAYTGDALGWHDRTAKHLDNWLTKQNTDPLDPNAKTGPDADSDLTRSEAMLHSNGDLTKSHYDMNLAGIDALFRHLLWTGDLDYARKNWPVIKRHLDWERRLLRREYGPDKLPLYEAYAAIWASDDLQYSGGGATHSSAFNYNHNLMAARIAEMIGEDPSPYRVEARLIKQAMQTYLWQSDRGWFGEYKDLLGNQLLHPSAGVWTNYHTIDSLAADPFQSWQMGRYIDTQIPHIPIAGPNVPTGYYQLSTTNWMPYTWSINNVVMAETVHTALSRFQAGQDEAGFATLKGAILDSMFLGQCPGNVGMCTYYDDYRRESQRDFADGVGMTSRSIVEGLFGIAPDALQGVLTVRPGFPLGWDHASIKHPDVSLGYKRDRQIDQFTIQSNSHLPRLSLQCPARSISISRVTLNGNAVAWKMMDDSIGTPRVRIDAEAAPQWDIKIEWQGEAPAQTIQTPKIAVAGKAIELIAKPATVLEISDPQHVLNEIQRGDDATHATTTGAIGHRIAFAKVKQGGLAWWLPIEFELRPAMFEIVDGGISQDDQHLRFRIRNNSAEPIERDVTFHAQDHATLVHLSVPAFGVSEPLSIASDDLTPGSNPISVAIGNETVEGVATNWKLKSKVDPSRWVTIDLSKQFNDRVTQIYKNEYLSPRSPFCSLSLAKDGIGMWTTFNATAAIDDSGLRSAAGRTGGKLMLPQGVTFATPSASGAKNVIFTSQWDNYPKSVSIDLSGKASHGYFLMAGSTNAMQSRIENGAVTITYSDGTMQSLSLINPTNWWPIEKDYFVDDFAFARPEPVPPRVDLKSGVVRIYDPTEIKGLRESIPGGAATILDLPLNPQKELRSVTLKTTANDVVIGVMAVTLVR